MSVEVTSNLYIVSKASHDAMINAAISIGMTVAGYAQDLCPVTLLVGTNVEYAPYVELGHRQQPGRFVPKIKKRLKRSWVPGKPFLRPAFENHRDEIEQIIISCCNTAE